MGIEAAPKSILTINGGSSTLKVALYGIGDKESLVFAGGAVRLGTPGGRLLVRDASGQVLLDREIGPADHVAAFQELIEWMDQHYPSDTLGAVGHRLVHGGSRFTEPQLITDELMKALQALVTIDPDHAPQSLRIIKLAGAHYPRVPQIACFDTAFHRHMPRPAEMYGLPRELYEQGILRYGFHGLSYEYICGELARINQSQDGGRSVRRSDEAQLSAGTDGRGSTPTSRVVVAHLGNGASMAAILNGIGIDTTMGFTPTAGLLMGTRCGDVDPGAIVHLMQERKMSPEEVNTLINKRSGLLGVSGSTEDMQQLLDREPSDARAAEAIQLFCYSAKKYLGAYAAALGGLDTVVFTGGIGENAPAIRARICSGLEFLGIEIDAGRNDANAPVISSDNSRVSVRVIKTNEDLMIARHAARLMNLVENRLADD